jgi:alpha-glucosidase
VKAGFLFPFLRNHCGRGQRAQEPFNLPHRVMQIMRKYIRLRYKLMPYLYGLFVQHESEGDPIMRPISYEYPHADLERCSDQFLIGPDLLQAPVLTEESRSRTVILPQPEVWYNAMNGTWQEPGAVKVRTTAESTPLFVRAGAIIPMQPGSPTRNDVDLRNVRLHIFTPPGWTGESVARVVADDGISFGYQRGEQSELLVRMVGVDGHLIIQTESVSEGYGPLEVGYVFHGPLKSVKINGQEPTFRSVRTTLTGQNLRVLLVGP